MGDPCDDRIESFSGHMAQVQSCDCTSANEKSSWRRLLSYMCSYIYQWPIGDWFFSLLLVPWSKYTPCHIENLFWPIWKIVISRKHHIATQILSNVHMQDEKRSYKECALHPDVVTSSKCGDLRDTYLKCKREQVCCIFTSYYTFKRYNWIYRFVELESSFGSVDLWRNVLLWTHLQSQEYDLISHVLWCQNDNSLFLSVLF